MLKGTMSRPHAGLSLLLAALMLLLMSGCGAATPTVTPVPSPTAEATTSPTVAEPAATDTPPLPTDTVAPVDTPTEEPAATPPAVSTPVAELQWQQVALQGNVVQDIALPPSGAGWVLATGPENAWSSAYDFKSWQPLTVKPTGSLTTASIGSADVAYITGHTGCASGLPMVLFHTTDAGKNWSELNPSSKPRMVAASTGGVAYGAACSGIIKSADSGANWSTLAASSIENYDPIEVVASPDGQTVFATYGSEGGTGRVNRSTDAGATWTEVTPKVAEGQEFRAPDNLTFVEGSEGSPQDAGLYLTTDLGLWFLPLEGNDWKAPKSDPRMDNPVNQGTITALYVDTNYSAEYEKPGPVIYIARSAMTSTPAQNLGVFRSTNQGLTWDPVGKDLGQAVANSLALAPHDPTGNPGSVETLIAGTADGIWTLPMPPPFK